MAQVRLLQQQHINRALWDECVAKAHNTLPYACSWYLDAVAQNWDGLVYGNYEAVMPLVWLRKLSLKCLYQPYYCQQLGVFSTRQLNANELAEFMKHAVSYAPYIEVNLNSIHKQNREAYSLTERKNLLLDLGKPYEVLRKGFSENHKRNIAKAEKAGVEMKQVKDVKLFKQFYLKNVNREKEKFTNDSEVVFNRLVDSLCKHNKGTGYAAYMDDEIVAVVLLVHSGNRLISIINSSSGEGKAKGASHFLYNGIIKQHAEKEGYVLDFEGSSVASIARFYEGFGAQQETFYRWKTHVVKRLSQRFK